MGWPLVVEAKGESFYNLIRGAGKLLVLDLGFLGDTIHLIPALRCLREALPATRLEVMVAGHIQSILALTPWLDAVHGYRRYPTSEPLYRQGQYIRLLRRSRYDGVVNLNGSDRSSLLTRLSGAPLRLGRVPPRPKWFWKHLFTHTVDVPHLDRPLFQARWDCLKAAGFPGEQPRFAAEVPAGAQAAVDAQLEGARGFIHVSPSTTLASKDLPFELLVEVLNTLVRERAGARLVLSCAPGARERERLAALETRLEQPPLKSFPGTLNLVEAAALVRRAGLHVGGDSGVLHIAFMLGVPTVSWFREYAGKVEWMPPGESHRAVVGVSTSGGIAGLTVEDFTTAVRFVLDKPDL